MKLLVDCQQTIPTLAEWFENHWGHLGPRLNRDFQEIRLRRSLNRDLIPLTLVAFRGAEPVGTACLSDEGHASRSDLSPWLEFVYVLPERRNEGIGSVLIDRAVKVSREIGIKELFLSTKSQEQLYSRLGWSVVERVADDLPAVIMSISTQA